MLLLGGLQAVGTRFDMDPDGISYLNLSDLYLRGDWGSAVNGYWSPAYPVLVGLFRRLLRPSPYQEAVAVHLLAFLIFLATCRTFQLFILELQRRQARLQASLAPNLRVMNFTGGIELVVAVAAFLWGALTLTSLERVGPDMLLAGIVFCIATLLLQVRSDRASIPRFLCLGVVLGLGYLTKAVMFPIGCFIALTWFAGVRSPGAAVPGTALILAAFLAVATPQLLAMSRLTGNPSYGLVGKLAYAGKVNGYTRWWIGEPPGSGVPLHPIRRIHRQPDAYEFASARESSSYPFWDSPAYWLAGIRPSFSLEKQALVVGKMLVQYARMLWPLVLSYVVLAAIAAGRGSVRFPYLLLPAASAFALYSLVHAEPRFFGAWSVILFLAAVSGLAFPSQRIRSARRVLIVAGMILVTPLAWNTVFRARQTAGLFTGFGQAHIQWTIASNLRKLGIEPGSKVASVGRAFDGYWARLAEVQIAMEVNEYDAPSYWSASDSVRTAVNEALLSHGARAVVMNRVPKSKIARDWVALGYDHYAFVPANPELRTEMPNPHAP